MSGATAISWTDKVWNPSVGCSRVSAGCDHCYAFQLHDQRHIAWKSGRFDSAPAQYHQPFSTVQLLPDRLDAPLRWRKPSRIFVDSMSDLFHDDVPDEYLNRVFSVMANAPQHTFQILTKRPERMREYLSEEVRLVDLIAEDVPAWPLPNVWLGVSVEDQDAADLRIPDLLQTPAAVHFISAEPLLGPVRIDRWLHDSNCPAPGSVAEDCICSEPREDCIDWVIAGGESGPHARRCDVKWIRSLLAQCHLSGDVPMFVKQMGSVPTLGTVKVPNGRVYPSGAAAMTYRDEPAPLKLRDRHGAKMAEWPADLQVQEFPG